MKNLLFLLSGLLLSIVSQGQTLIQAEYFFDTDPGLGQGIPITFSPTDSLSLDSLVINNSGLTLGYHYLYVRAENSDGVWGLTERKRVYIYDHLSNIEVSPPLVSGEYYFDQDTAGPGGGISFTFPPDDSISLDLQAITPNLTIGPHIVYVRVKDSLGFWSFPQQITFDVCSTYSPLAGFDYIQYGSTYSFLDTSQNAIQYFWDFGDGFTDSVSNPSHLYTSPGVYELKQVVENGCGIDSMMTTIIHEGIESHFPKMAGDTGWVTISFYGGFQDADSLSIKLSRIGQTDIFAPDSMITIADNSLIQASFLLNYEEHGFWDISLSLDGDTTYILQDGLEIEEVKLDYHVEVLAPANGFRFARDNQVVITFTNLSNVNLQYPNVALVSHNTDVIGNTKSELGDSLLTMNLLFVDTDENPNGLIYPDQMVTSSFFTRTTPVGLSLGVAGPSPTSLFEKAEDAACERWSGGNCSCVPDDFYYFSFSSACDRHDRCYECCGANKHDCDKIFHFDLIKECQKNPAYFGPCIVAANTYFTGVHFAGQPFYDNAQANCTNNCDPPPPPPMDIAGPCIPIAPGFKCKEIAGSGAIDPNDKFGNQGYGIDRYMKEQNVSYGIRFENVDTATAPAAVVTITDTLDQNAFDINSFSFGSFIIADSLYTIPPNRNEYTVDIDFIDSLNLILRLNAFLDDSSGVIKWKFLSIDPLSKELISDLRGFLPPNVISPEGEGMVTYSINLIDNLPHDTEIKNRASIIFDSNEAIITDYWSNKLDLIAPISSVNSLASTISTADLINDTLLIVNWSGSDQGSGILHYDIFLSQGNDTSFTKWQSLTQSTFDTLAVQPGESYRFYSIAYDGVGNVEIKGDTIEAATTILSSTNIDNQDFLSRVKIYPNPSTDLIYVDASHFNQSVLEVKINSLIGQEIRSYTFHPNNRNRIFEKIDITDLPSGIYLISIAGDNEADITQKLIKH